VSHGAIPGAVDVRVANDCQRTAVNKLPIANLPAW
jgi:hypothetical protein